MKLKYQIKIVNFFIFLMVSQLEAFEPKSVNSLGLYDLQLFQYLMVFKPEWGNSSKFVLLYIIAVIIWTFSKSYSNAYTLIMTSLIYDVMNIWSYESVTSQAYDVTNLWCQPCLNWVISFVLF